MVSISTHTRSYTGQFLYPELYSGTSGTSTDATLCISGLRHFSHLIVGSCVSLDTTTVPLPSPRKFFLMSPIRLCRRHCLVIFLLLLQGNVGSLGSRRPVSLLLSLLLLSSGDVELNPGPARNWKYPCGVCSKPVRSDQKGVQCDLCSTWLHARCIGLSLQDYFELQSSDDAWSCSRCIREAMPFGDVSNSDSVFHVPSNNSLNSTCNSTINNPPIMSNLKVLHSNCRSLLPKIDDFRALVSAETPHLLAICESWLDSSISNDELLIPGYNIVRRDRDRHGGGIALYISTDISYSTILKHSSLEFLLVEVILHNSKLLCALFYRPPVTPGTHDSIILSELESTIEALPPSKLKKLHPPW